MKVGVTLWFQNLPDFFDRGKRDDYSRPQPVSDAQIYVDELYLADLVEPLGFDSMWAIEHHFSPYGLTCNPYQLFAYMAGRTTSLELGTMVTVLPWQDPLRVAEGIAVLDNLSRGRPLHLGFGRGAAPQEFESFRVDYESSRERMAEAFEIVRLGLTQEWFSFSGHHFEIPETTIRPRPLQQDLTTSMMLAWSSEQTMEWAAHSGAGALFSNFSRWDKVASNTARFNEIRARHGWAPVAPVASGPVFCSTDRDEAERAREWYRQTFDSSVWHYGLFHQPSLRAQVEGKSGKALEKAIADIYESATRVGVFGSPDECIEQISSIQTKTELGTLIAHMNFGLMRRETAEKSMRLFAAEVLPELHKIETLETPATSFHQVRAERPAGDSVAV